MKSYSLRRSLRVLWHRFYPWTALNGLDKKLVQYISTSPGFFIEAGANDGVRQSNTYYLEKRLGWTGLLVEPIPHLANQCRRNRSKSIVEQCVLVDEGQDGWTFDVMDLDLMTIVLNQEHRGRETERHIEDAERVQGIQRSMVKVGGRSLSNLLDAHSIRSIDLLSLDVEGAEMTVLSGLDLNRHTPRLILIETQEPKTVSSYLGGRYSLVTQLSHHDYLFRLK